jgi:hypothetical protein
MPCSVRTTACSGEHRAFVVEQFFRNGGSPILTLRAFRIHFALGRRDPVPDKENDSHLGVYL